MRQDQIDRVDAALKKGYDTLAGDELIHVTSEGVQTQLLVLMYDLEFDRREGLVVQSVGVMNDGIRELIFLKHYLATEGVVLEPTDHWIIDSERWDFIPNNPIMEAIVPMGGLHNMVVCWVTRAAAINQTAQSAEWSWQQQ